MLTFILTTSTIPQGSITILCLYPWGHLDNTTFNIPEHTYIPGAIWTIQHLTNTLAFKDH